MQGDQPDAQLEGEREEEGDGRSGRVRFADPWQVARHTSGKDLRNPFVPAPGLVAVAMIGIVLST